jgi:ubiquinone/menaquinone biosynthesis C-methylase UbiE/chorismate mutase
MLAFKITTKEIKQPSKECVMKKLLEMMAWRLSRIDRHLISVLAARLGSGGVSDWVAKAKVDDGSSPNRDDVEEKRLAMAAKWADETGLNHNFAAMMLFAMIDQSFRRQSVVTFERSNVIKFDINNVGSEKNFKFHRQQLLALTKDVAPSYDQRYGRKFGIKTYLDFEREKISELVSSVQNQSTAIDLGCATGEVAFSLAEKFDRVFGYDISPDMIAVATKKAKKMGKTLSKVCFKVVDLELRIPLPDNSVSVAVMNMGTASDIRNIDQLLEEVRRVLLPGGKFLLSFYNAESLLAKFGYLPWQASLPAIIDREMDVLDVTFDPGHSKGPNLYLIYAKPRSIDEVSILLEKYGLGKANKFMTHPTLAGILPEDIMSTEKFESYNAPVEGKRCLGAKVSVGEAADAQKSLIELDRHLSKSPLNLGAYIIVKGEKS